MGFSHAAPKAIRYDAKVRDGRPNDFGGVSVPSVPPAGPSVLHPGLSPKDQDTSVELIVKDAVAASRVAVDG